MVLEILCVEPIHPQYSGVLETCLALRYWFFEVLGSESVKAIGENKILTNIYEFTIPLVQLPLSVSLATLVRVV